METSLTITSKSFMEDLLSRSPVLAAIIGTMVQAEHIEVLRPIDGVAEIRLIRRPPNVDAAIRQAIAVLNVLIYVSDDATSPEELGTWLVAQRDEIEALRSQLVDRKGGDDDDRWRC